MTRAGRNVRTACAELGSRPQACYHAFQQTSHPGVCLEGGLGVGPTAIAPGGLGSFENE